MPWDPFFVKFCYSRSQVALVGCYHSVNKSLLLRVSSLIELVLPRYQDLLNMGCYFSCFQVLLCKAIIQPSLLFNQITEVSPKFPYLFPKFFWFLTVDTLFNRRYVGRDTVMASSEISSTFQVRKKFMVHCYFLPKPKFHRQTPAPPFSNKSRSCCCEP